MKLSLTALVAVLAAPSALAFAPSTSSSLRTTALAMSDEESADVAPPAPAPLGPTLNGWTPDASKPCYGLPGAILPLGYFDPLGFCTDRSLAGVKRFREAEVLHSRVAMMAVVGYLIGENTPTITYGFDVPTIANNQIPEVSFGVMFPFFLLINIVEALRASRGWVEPGVGELFTLRENYYPGDIGFDPLGLKPTDPKEFESMQAKELSNGRLAMFAVAGMCVQELVNGQPVLQDLPL